MKKRLCFALYLFVSFNVSGQSIWGGSPVTIGQVPYQALIKVGSGVVGGGVIISDRWVIVAAHGPYFWGWWPGSPTHATVQVLGGVTDPSNLGSAQVRLVDTVIIHPGNTFLSTAYDIALMRLSAPLTFNGVVQPIEYANQCNTTTSDIGAGVNTYVSGYGTPLPGNTTGPLQPLQGLTLPILSPAQYAALIPASVPPGAPALASYDLPLYASGQGSTVGDSGGPAVITKNGKKILVGIMSSNYANYNPANYPVLCVNVRDVDQWIYSVTGIGNQTLPRDLYIKDDPNDFGFEPNVTTSLFTNSPAIWVRNANDGGTVHQNPKYVPNNPNARNYISVEIRNRGCRASGGTDTVHLYWTKASTATSWPYSFNGSYTCSGSGASMGQELLPPKIIPVIQPNQSYIATWDWKVPDPYDYVGCCGNFFPALDVWLKSYLHFCLLAKIKGPDNPLYLTESQNSSFNAKYNNDIAQKNVTVVDLNPNALPEPGVLPGGGVLVGAPRQNGGTFSLSFATTPGTSGNPITAEAEVKLTLTNELWAKWQAGGFQGDNVTIFNAEYRQISITGANASLLNLSFQPYEQLMMCVSFNFLADQMTNQTEYFYTVTQKSSEDIVGAENFIIRKQRQERFIAYAGRDEEIIQQDSVTLKASLIAEPAIYNWYDQKGSLVHTGTDFTVFPGVTTTYKLETIATSDGFKDYDEVEVKVKEAYISSVSPIPATTTINVGYNTAHAKTAYLKIVHAASGLSSQYAVNPGQKNKTIDVSSYRPGVYKVILVCDGRVIDSKTLSIK